MKKRKTIFVESTKRKPKRHPILFWCELVTALIVVGLMSKYVYPHVVDGIQLHELLYLIPAGLLVIAAVGLALHRLYRLTSTALIPQHRSFSDTGRWLFTPDRSSAVRASVSARILVVFFLLGGIAALYRGSLSLAFGIWGLGLVISMLYIVKQLTFKNIRLNSSKWRNLTPH